MSAVNKTLNIAAPPERIRAIILDVPSYPQWQKETVSTEVHGTDAEGRPTTMTISVSALGKSATYTVAFDYANPDCIAYHLLEGDMITKQDVCYTIKPLGDGTTDLTVEIEVALQWSLPEPMINQLALKGVRDLLQGVKKRAEGGAT